MASSVGQMRRMTTSATVVAAEDARNRIYHKTNVCGVNRRHSETYNARRRTDYLGLARIGSLSSARDEQGWTVLTSEEKKKKKKRGEDSGFGRRVRSVPAWHPDTEEQELSQSFDKPTSGFASIQEALEDIKLGKFVVVLDDEDRENEGDLIGAADMMTEKSMAFMIRYTSGLVCVSMEDERADLLELPLMVDSKSNKDYMKTAFTVSCDLVTGTTGISAGERANTINALANKETTARDLVRPGHVFPLRYREGGVLKRAGHTEAAVDLSRMAGRAPVGVLCEIVNDDGTGSMSRLPELKVFAKTHDLKMVLISDMIRYRRATEKNSLIERTAIARVPTEHGSFTAVSYVSKVDGIEHVAFVYGDHENADQIAGALKDNALVRVHSECLTGDIFKSARCDCGNQLEMAMKRIAQEKKGAIVYLRGQEGRGIGLGHKLRAYNLQDKGRDTVQANEDLGLPVDSREYGVGAQILNDLGVRSVRLMTNNPAKYHGLRGYGITVTGRVPLFAPITLENKTYLEAKRTKMGHLFNDESVDFEAAATVATPMS